MSVKDRNIDKITKLGLNPETIQNAVVKRMKNQWHVQPNFQITVNHDKCIGCALCVACDYQALTMVAKEVKDPAYISNKARTLHQDSKVLETKVVPLDKHCVGCDWCIHICPTDALVVENYGRTTNNEYWDNFSKDNIRRQTNTGAKLLAAMGSEGVNKSKEKSIPRTLDYIHLDAAQVTNPSIDPLREPMELKTFLGSKSRDPFKELPEMIELNTPVVFGHMSFGAISPNAQLALAMAAQELGIIMGTGEGGLYEGLKDYGQNIVVQVASGRFGVDVDYLNAGVAVSIKIGQGAKPGIGGHLPGVKVNELIAETRGIPIGTDALSPAPHHDIYSIEDLKQLIYAIKEVTDYKPVEVKIAATHNVEFIASGIARAGADIISIDGFRGGTGAAPLIIRDNIGMDIALAISKVDLRLRNEKYENSSLRNKVSLIASGGVRSSADVLKLIMLGADAVGIGTAALMCFGCTACGTCNTNRCNYGITTMKPYLYDRLDPEMGAERLINLVRGWSKEIKELLGAMGLSTIEGVRSNREKLRAIGLPEYMLEQLGIKKG